MRHRFCAQCCCCLNGCPILECSDEPRAGCDGDNQIDDEDCPARPEGKHEVMHDPALGKCPCPSCLAAKTRPPRHCMACGEEITFANAKACPDYADRIHRVPAQSLDTVK